MLLEDLVSSRAFGRMHLKGRQAKTPGKAWVAAFRYFMCGLVDEGHRASAVTSPAGRWQCALRVAFRCESQYASIRMLPPGVQGLQPSC